MLTDEAESSARGTEVVVTLRDGTKVRYNTMSWLGDLHDAVGLGDKRSLNTLRMLGTHDSATYRIEESSDYAPERASLRRVPAAKTTRKVVADWSKAQSRCVYQQLLDGVRYLDIRLTSHVDHIAEHAKKRTASTPERPLELWVPHGMLSVRFAEVVNDLRKYLDLPGTEREIIILDIQHLKAFEQTTVGADAMHQLVIDTIAPLKPFLLRIGPTTANGCQSPTPEEVDGDQLGSSAKRFGTLKQALSAPLSDIWRHNATNGKARGTIVLLYPDEGVCGLAATEGAFHIRQGHIANPFFDTPDVSTLLRRLENNIMRSRHETTMKLQQLCASDRAASGSLVDSDAVQPPPQATGVSSTGEPLALSTDDQRLRLSSQLPEVSVARLLQLPLHVTQAQLTPQTSCIVKSVFSRPFAGKDNKPSLLRMAQKSNPPMLMRWAAYNIAAEAFRLNVQRTQKPEGGSDPSQAPPSSHSSLSTSSASRSQLALIEAKECPPDCAHCNILILDFYEVGEWAPSKRRGAQSQPPPREKSYRPGSGSSTRHSRERESNLVDEAVLLNAARTCIELNLPVEERWADFVTLPSPPPSCC